MMKQAGFRGLLKDSGFQAFLWTQFLGALNDNLYKTIVSLRAVHVAASGGREYLALAGAVFVAPFLLFSGYAGHLADRYSKRSVMIAVKAFEIGVMGAGLAAFFTQNMALMLAVLFLMALHSTVFSPAKYGIVPEMLPAQELSRANGLLEMSTFVAIVLGTAISTLLYTLWGGAPWKMGIAMIGVAVVGFLVSRRIPGGKTATRSGADVARAVQPAVSRVVSTLVDARDSLRSLETSPRMATQQAGQPAPHGNRNFQWNPLAEVIDGTKNLLRDRPLWLTVLGISYFWMLGALFQLDLLLYGGEVLRVDDVHMGVMLTSLAIGIGAGSLLAGKFSGDRVELGLVPVGSALMGLCSVWLAVERSSYAWSVVVLAAVGLASGLFIVPLNAFLQYRSGSAEKGRMIATNNFFNTVGLLIASAAIWLFHDRLHFSPERLILGAGALTLAATGYVIYLLPDHLIRFVLRTTLRMLFRIRAEGRERVPHRGPALLVSNHVSFVDGLLIAAATERRVRFMVWKPYYQHWALNWFFRQVRAIPVGTRGLRDMREAILAAREQLQQGRVVCIFAEGSITRTGNLQPFKRGLEKIAHGLDVPVVPVYLDRMWGSIFSYAGGRFFSHWPRRLPYPVTASFGAPLASTATAQEVRQAILELGANAVPLRKRAGDTLPARFVRNARRSWRKFAMADSTGRELTYGRTLTASLLVSDWVRRHSAGREMLGVLLPASVGGALVNLGIALAGRIPVNLNFTSGKDAFASAIEQCSIRTIVTSKAFLTKAKLEPAPGMVFLEEILAAPGFAQKLWALVRARLAPVARLATVADPDQLATVLFSSGSTSTPKGVMLSHYSVIANIEAMLQVFGLTSRDRVMGALPFFHSFGFTVTIWLPVLAGCGAIYHPNPLDAKTIGELVERYRGTLLLATPTFAATYARKCTRQQFASLRLVLAGAEKLRESVAGAFEEAFGLKILEGYGCTEMAPVVAVNIPDYQAGRESQLGSKPGSVGRPLPGVAARIVHMETGAPLPAGQDGLLLVKGANQMLGYLGQPEQTAAVLRDGWYSTGDVAVADEEGFLHITGRLARFSKIGGEMVPHTKVEEAVTEATGGAPCAVAGVPDEVRGERIALLYTSREVSPEQLWQRLSAANLPKLWLPKRDDIHQVETLPTLGSGKLDLRAVQNICAAWDRPMAGQTPA